MIAEYADKNNIVFELPQEEGLGTFVWEPIRWEQTLFTSGQTNDRIAIYPQLWDNFGNDTLPQKNLMVSVGRSVPANRQSDGGSGWFDGRGMVRMDNGAEETAVFMVNMLGRAVGRVQQRSGATIFPARAQGIYIARRQELRSNEVNNRLFLTIR